MGKELEKEYIYIYIYIYVCVCVNHFAVHLKLTQHCKSTIVQYKIKIKERMNETEKEGKKERHH